MKKYVFLIILLLIACVFVWQTNNQEQLKFEPTLLNPLGPTVIPVAAITGNQITEDTSLNVHFYKSNDEAIAMLTSDSGQFVVLPITVAANMYNRGIDIVMLGVHEWKVFYLISSTNNEFDNWNSLKGKTVYTPVSRGQTADILMRLALSEEGINPDTEVEILYAPPQEIVALFKAGKIEFAALPEPFATLAIYDGSGVIVLDFQEYWGNTFGIQERLPIAGLFVKRDFINEYPKDTKNIVNLFNESVNWSNTNIDKAVEIAGKVLTISPEIMKTALSRIDFYYVPTNKCRDEVHHFLSKMHELYPEGLPNLPDEGFYVP